MIALAVPEPDDDLAKSYMAEFEAMTTEQLYDALREGLGLVAEKWVRNAFVIKVLESRGEDVTKLRSIIGGPLVDWLRRVAAGNLEPQLVSKYYWNKKLVNLIGKLPRPDQIRLAKGDRVPVVVPDQHGGWTTRLKSLEEIWQTKEEISQVFAPRGSIRTEGEQTSYLDGVRRQALAPALETVGKFRVDRDRGVVIFVGKRGDSFDEKTLATVLRALRKTA